VDLGAAVVADKQPLQLVQPGEGGFDDPAGMAEARAVPGLPASDLWDDPTLSEFAPVRQCTDPPDRTQEVGGSSPPGSTSKRPANVGLLFFG